jgi:tetratricopeptide (TPR) repeat protein
MKRSAKSCLVLVVLFLLALGCAAGISIYLLMEHSRGIRFANAGYRASQRRDFVTALSKYDAAIHCRLDNYNLAMVYCGRGIARINRKQFDPAIADLTESIRRVPSLAQAFGYRGSAYHQKGELDRALVDYSRAIGLDPNQGYVLLSRGRILLQRGAVDDALKDFDEAVRASPDDPQPLIDRGVAYQRKNYLSSAIASFESALRLDPNNKTARGFLEEITSGRANPAEAFAAVSRKSAQDLQFAAAAQKLGVKDLPRNDWSDNSMEEVVANNLFQHGLTALRSRNYQEAVKLFSEALEHHPSFESHRALLCNRGYAYARLNQMAKAMEDYAQAIQFDPKYAEPYYDRGIAERAQGQLDEALSDFSEALRLNPRFAQAFIARASVFVRRHDLVKAAADYGEASRTIDSVELEHRHILLNDLAWMRATSSFETLRDGKEAVADAIKANELVSWSKKEYIETLAAAYAEAGNFDAAVNYQLWAASQYEARKDDQQERQKRVELYRQRKPYRALPNK